MSLTPFSIAWKRVLQEPRDRLKLTEKWTKKGIGEKKERKRGRRKYMIQTLFLLWRLFRQWLFGDPAGDGAGGLSGVPAGFGPGAAGGGAVSGRGIVQWLLVLALGLPLSPAHGQQTVKYVHTDALGSVVAMTNASGAVIETTREYEPYGQQLVPVIQDGPGYTGHVQDAATGLTYMQQRYYDPVIGRFLSTDPVTALSKPARMFNRYRYAANNPYRFVDPDGRYECTAGKSNCARLERAVNEIHRAAESAPSGSRVAQVSQFLGKPGEKNGVVISGQLQNDKNLGEATPTFGGGTHIGLNFAALSDTDRLSSVTMHEGSHGVDQDDRNVSDQLLIMSRSALNVSELKANEASARMFEILGRDEPFGLYTKANGINWDAINEQADRSVEQLCPTADACNP
ncbi:RHS repeat domain-containing protein [Pseudoxanthomonas suwonensis]|uniref:RHS repeat domain-containing protein n=1 Tax=Pseudoxanthomonas suwonensis TaxID=314722 RepID=UPI001F31B6C0|nr:RHS repeat-associated core domain-containing protein [Pseudoxanthomonas suwonensis]